MDVESGGVRRGPRVWVVLPAFNEEQGLPLLLPRLAAALRERGVDFRLVVVDDGSVDGTPQVLEGFRADLPLDVVRHPINRGLGEAERDGFEFVAARCERHDLIVRVESDNTHDPRYIFVLLDKLAEGFDVVNTSRFQPGGGQVGVSAYRALVSRAANLFMKAVFPIRNIRDYSCGFRAYRASIIQDAIRIFGNNLIQLKGMGFTSTLEIIVKLDLLGSRFSEVPFVLRYDLKGGPSKMVGSVTTFGYLTMAVLCYWPFGGWRRQYRGLRAMYRGDAGQAVEIYGKTHARRFGASQIGF